MGSETERIDFVITWVDGSDADWRQERDFWLARENTSATAVSQPNFYRSWDNLQYLLRGVEKFAPWVGKVHLVTCGQRPAWLDISCPKLNFVTHQQFMPAEYLPTFSSSAIELNLHRISGLAERFVYFNDDIFPIAPLAAEDFFINGLPCDNALLGPAWPRNTLFEWSVYNSMQAIERNFDLRKVVFRHPRHWLYSRFGRKMINTLRLLASGEQLCLRFWHTAFSYTKATYQEVWEAERELLYQTSLHKFRHPNGVNQYIFRYWRLAAAQFYPYPQRNHVFYEAGSDEERMCRDIREQRFKLICCNDNDMVFDFERAKNVLNESLAALLPDKSCFELP